MVPDAAEEAQDGGLSLRRSVDGRAVVVRAVGEVDHDTAPRLSDELAKALQAAEVPVVLDLTGVSFMTSAGLSVLVEHHQRGRQRDHGLHIVVGDSVVSRALERTGLLPILSVYATLTDALPDEC